MRKPLVACALLSIVALAAGCGGGGGSSAVIPSAGGHAGGSGSTGAVVSIVIPAKPIGALSRSPAYVSPYTASIGIVVTPQGGTAYPVVYGNIADSACLLAPGGGYTCTIPVTATFGTDTLEITDYSGTNGTGNVLATGSLTTTFAPGPSPAPINVVLTGRVKGIDLSFALGGFASIGQSLTLNVVGRDASGAMILGSYDAPITLALPANSGLSLATTTFADSTHTTSTVSWTGGPTYPNAPVNDVTITGSSPNGTTGAVAVHPTTTLLSFALGTSNVLFSGTNGEGPVALVADGSKLLALTSDFSSNGTLHSFDPATGVEQDSSALGFDPAGLYVDGKYHGIWISGGGALHCFTSVGSADAPVAVPTAGANPGAMTQDPTGDLWFTDVSDVGSFPLVGQCDSSDAIPSLTPYPSSPNPPDAYAIGADLTNGTIWVADGANKRLGAFGSGSGQLPLPGSPTAVGYDGAGNLAIASFDQFTAAASIGIIAQDDSTITTTYALPKYSVPENISAIASTVHAVIAYGDGGYGGLGLYDPQAPTLSTVIPAVNPVVPAARARVRTAGVRPAIISGSTFCAGAAFDANGSPWVLCSGSNGAQIERLIVTGQWQAFADLAGLRVGQITAVGIAGGAPSTTFTVTCTGGVTCTQDPNFPRIIVVHGVATGDAGISIGGSDGKGLGFGIAVLPNIS